MEFFATCGKGLETVLGDELRRIGVHSVRPLNAGVSFQGELEDAYQALLWSRVASRVLLTLGRVDGSNADTLYAGIREIPWEQHIGKGRTFAVDARGTNDALRDTRFTGLRVKDAIVDRLRDIRGERPDVDTDRPDVRVNVNLGRNKAKVSIDLSGAPLEQRGYRAQGRAQGTPIRENLAAALLLMAGWGKPSLSAATLSNPLCASGTIAVEAAMIAGDIAPGIMRSTWGFEGWAGHDPALWERLLDEADERAAAAKSEAHVIASDVDSAALDYARACAKRAGVAKRIVFKKENDVASLAEEGCDLLVCNVPYGSRMARAQLPMLYASVSSLIKAVAEGGMAVMLAADPDIDVFLGVEATDAHDVKNGAIDCSARLYTLDGEHAASRATVSIRDTQIPVNDEAAQQFASRLNKVYKARRKWAKKEGVSAYRVYDADLPDYNVAIDIYNGAGPDAGAILVHVAEYAPPKQIEPAKAARRLADALRIIPVVLDVPTQDVYVKQRVRAKGGSQYAGKAGAGSLDSAVQSTRFMTQENGLLFEVDLGDYLDTGLFLDHRMTRALLRTLAKGKSFLNLFAYTGTASVYAAAGGAKFTTTVDISNTYQQWAQRNMRHNGLMDRHQEFVRADVLAWVEEMRHSKNRWDLVFVDPPTFSNSSKMGKHSWDVQRDHAELLISVSRLLTRNGAAVFSCNLRSFKPDVETLAKAGVQIVDITDKTIPEDFERNRKVHCCYLLRRA